MRLTFIGADHEVTGSCHVLDACGKHILIDYGMEQGRNVLENKPLPCPSSDIDYVLLTHAHIDHSGLLPLLYANGFRGEVWTTLATSDLCDIMLRDSAHIQMFEAEWQNRKGRRAGKDEIQPLYTMEDALGVIERIHGYPYDQRFQLCDGIEICFTDAGHLLGSSSIEVWVTEEEQTRKLIFSGDIGNINQPLIRDPQYLSDADYVIMESTYGDRSHGPRPDYIKDLSEIIQQTFDRGGNVVIPSFAVGRTQELLYFIREIKKQGLIQGHDGFEVYVDSPLAIEATNIFIKNEKICFDEEAAALVNAGINPLVFDGLKLSVTSSDSRNINFDYKPKVIISASGMCEAGRIRHHLKHNLWRPECTILFVGYQALGTLGRTLIDDAPPSVKLFGEVIEIHAHIRQLAGISGHADQHGLLEWLQAISPKPQQVFVVHGEDKVTASFASMLQTDYGYVATAPFSGSEFDLLNNCWISETEPVYLERRKPATIRANDVFSRLLSAGQRLLTVIRHNEGGANKDLAKLTDQINNLCDKWDR